MVDEPGIVDSSFLIKSLLGMDKVKLNIEFKVFNARAEEMYFMDVWALPVTGDVSADFWSRKEKW